MKKILLILCYVCVFNASCKTSYEPRTITPRIVDSLPPYSMEMFNQCVAELKVIEGFRSTSYKDGSFYSIGYGHQITPTDTLTVLTKSQANILLEQDFKERIDWVHKKYNFTGNKLLAASRFAFNMGIGRAAYLFDGTNVEARWLLYCKWRSPDTKELKVSKHILASRIRELEMWKS